MRTIAFLILLSAVACKSTGASKPLTPDSSLRANEVRPTNGVMMQYFHWYNTKEDELWKRMAKDAKALGDAGITALWLPPAYKGSGGENDVGYGVYDIYDLGEFDQKGSVRTKYGTKDDYIRGIAELKKHGVQSYADVVLNHRFGADRKEPVKAVNVNRNNRMMSAFGTDIRELKNRAWNNLKDKELEDIEAYTLLDFAARKGKYSTFTMNWRHFTGTDWNGKWDSIVKICFDEKIEAAKKPEECSEISKNLFLFEGKEWNPNVLNENGNYDYLMASDVDFSHPEVRKELIKWGQWYVKTTGVDGLRIDAVKHIDYTFWKEFIKGIEQDTKKDMFVVGEYLELNNVDTLTDFIKNAGEETKMHVFDFPLHTRFHQASAGNGGYDMAGLFEGTVLAARPDRAMTLVDNHDTQPCQAFGSSAVLDWFKPLGYAFILLNKDGYPNVFYPDYYGMNYQDKVNGQDCRAKSDGHKKAIDKLLAVRRDIAFGGQYNYGRGENGHDVVGFIRDGGEFSKGLAMLINDGPASSRYMKIGERFKGQTYCNIFGGNCTTLDENGGARFDVSGGGLAVYVDKSVAAKYSN